MKPALGLCLDIKYVIYVKTQSDALTSGAHTQWCVSTPLVSVMDIQPRCQWKQAMAPDGRDGLSAAVCAAAGSRTAAFTAAHSYNK